MTCTGAKEDEMKKLVLIITFGIFFSPIGTFAQTLFLYGGDNHNVYLGCLNCNSYDANSIWNEYGTYGSSYNQQSIWNEYGTYGSEYNAYSPWNEYSNDPPVVVDKEGNFYGYLTMNEYKTKRAEFELALILYKYHDLIKNDVSKWYNKIFE
jgi:hypothetical protein